MFYELAEKALALEKEGRKVTRLNLGDTNLPTPERAIEAGVARMRSAKSGYGSSAGMMELRQKIAEREKCDVKNVVVGPGSKSLIYGLMSILCKRGESVAFPTPYWPAYELACRQLELKEKRLDGRPDEGWAFNAHDSGRARMLIVCNPLNPTSTIYDEKLVNEAISVCAENGTHMLLDEAYKGLAFREMPRYEGVMRVRSFSKEFNMEGWRLGYVVAPEDIAKRLIAFNQITSTCVAPFVQAAGIACLEDEKAILAQNRRDWRTRSEAAQSALSKAGFSFAKPEAGIYIFAMHPGIRDSGEFALELLEKEGIAVAPGTEFGGYRQHIRLCLNRPEYVLAEAIGRMGQFLGKR
jgi:aspartate aminotransferase